MMLPSHLLSVLAMGLLIGLLRGRALAPKAWLLIIGFGVVIDLDHLLAVPAYIAHYGLAAMNPTVGVHYGSSWQGFMHTPWAILIVVAGMWWWHSLWPAIGWGIHMFEDFVIARHYVHFGGVQEWLIVAGLAALVFALWRIDGAITRARSNARFLAMTNQTLR